jgi:DNA-directed RNA polymerase subunit RPC12/RpoP
MEIECPHCQQKIWIEELNCGIFRCGVLKENGEQIPPHASKEECDNYINNNLIIGCGKPFMVSQNNNEYIAIVCDYI